MRGRVLCILLATTACTVHSGVKTGPTYVPAALQPAKLEAAEPTQPAPVKAKPARSYGPAIVRPTPDTMNGATWVIEDFDQSRIYQVPVQTGRVTTLRLPSGEKFNAAVGGNVEAFLVNVSYAGVSPAVSIVPREPGARSNLQLTTTGDVIYSFDLVTGGRGVNLVEVRRPELATATHGAAEQSLTPQGDYTRLNLGTPDGRQLPAWAPGEAWADSDKLVIRFPPGPLPVLPALFAGQQGEQIVSYRTVIDQGATTLVTRRRVTEAQLRLDQEVVTITAAEAAQDDNPHGWRQAGTLPPAAPQAASSPVNVYVMPGSTDGVIPATALTDAPLAGVATNGPGAGQPMANHIIQQGPGV
jgi:hypothetical protein